MNYLKKLGISFGICLASFFVLTFFITFLHYLNIMSYKTVSILKILIPIISLFIGGFLLGKKSSKKGWLEGIKFGAIFLVFLFLLNYLGFQHSFEIKDLIFYLIIMISAIFGSMIGINRKRSH